MQTTSETTPASRSRRLRRLWISAVTVLAVGICFGPALSSGTLITHPESILRLPLLSRAGHLPRVFSRHFMSFTDGEYRPLSYAMIGVMRSWVSADNATFWHLWLLGFHVLNAWLVYAIARQFTGRAASSAAGAVFLLHPLASAFTTRINLFYQVSAVSFYLGCFLCYLRCVRRRSGFLYAVALVLFGCGLLTSKVLLTLPALLFLVDVLYSRSKLRRVIPRLLPFVALAVLAVWLTSPLQPHPMHYRMHARLPSSPTWHGLHSYVGRGVEGLFYLAAGRHVPGRMGVLIGPFEHAWNVRFVFWGSVITIVLIAALPAMRRRAWVGVGLFLAALGTAPMFISPYVMTDDYRSWALGCLPLAGFALVFGAVVDVLLRRLRVNARRVVPVMAVLPVVAWAVLLTVANVRSRSPVTLWQYALEQNEAYEKAAVELGKAYLALDRPEEALLHLFNPRLGSIRESCMAMAHYYAARDRRIEATVHLLIGAGEETDGLLYQDDMDCVAHIMFRFNAPDHAENALGKLLMANPASVRGLCRMARVLMLKGYLHGARTCLRGALQIDPADVEARRLLADLRRRLVEPARPDARRIDGPDPEWLRYVIGQGISTRLEEQVIAHANDHLRDPVMQLGAAICLMGNARGERPLVRLDMALKRLSGVSHVVALKVRAAAFEERPEIAAEIIRNPGRILPRDHLTWHRLADSLVSFRRFDLAIDAYRVALRAAPDAPDTHNNLGVLLLRRADFKLAAKHLTIALDLPPDKVSSVHNDLGFALAELGRYEEAMRRFRLAIEYDPTHPEPWRHMARVRQRMGDHVDALRITENAIKLFPADEKLKMRLAWVLATSTDMLARDGKRAVEVAEGVVQRASKPQARMLDVLAAAYAENGQFDEAEARAQEAIRLARRSRQGPLVRNISRHLAHFQRRLPFRETFDVR